jgi:hypothetical protein
LQRLRAIQVLEWIGSEPAREILEHLTRGPRNETATYDAMAALARIRGQRKKPD